MRDKPGTAIESAAKHKRLRGKRILMVDDDQSVREALVEVLRVEGYSVRAAANGEEAINVVNETPIDLVVLDLNMPVKNGWDTFEELTSQHPLIPVIIATARSNQLFMALNAGAGALLEKPLDIPMLLRTIEMLLAETSEQRLARLAGRKSEFHYHSRGAKFEGGINQRFSQK